MEIKYPVRYDKFNQIIVDSTPRTICLMSWQGLRMELANIEKFGMEVAMAMNDAHERSLNVAVDISVPVENVDQPKRRGNPAFQKGVSNPYIGGK